MPTIFVGIFQRISGADEVAGCSDSYISVLAPGFHRISPSRLGMVLFQNHDHRPLGHHPTVTGMIERKHPDGGAFRQSSGIADQNVVFVIQFETRRSMLAEPISVISRPGSAPMGPPSFVDADPAAGSHCVTSTCRAHDPWSFRAGKIVVATPRRALAQRADCGFV